MLCFVLLICLIMLFVCVELSLNCLIAVLNTGLISAFLLFIYLCLLMFVIDYGGFGFGWLAN